MKRPAFQFYPGDWRKNAKLRRCTPAARGVWIDILCLFHDSEEEYGLLRWPLKDIANAAGATMALARELVDKGVLKGADRDAPAYVYRPKHAGKLGEPVVLAIADGGPLWYSSRMVRDEWVRQKRGGSTRFDTDHQPDNRSPNPTIGERLGDGPSSSSSPSGSVPTGTDAAGASSAPDKSEKPKADPEKQRLWREGKALLVADGMTRDEAGKFIGKLAHDYPDDKYPSVVRDAVDATIKATPPEPRAYLVATCQRLAGERNTIPSDAADKTKAAQLAEDRRFAAEDKGAIAAGIAAAKALAGLKPKTEPTEGTHVDA